MTTRLANITAWTERADRCITLAISHHDLRATVYLTPERAAELIDELQCALAQLPAAVTAADLGIEGAPV